MYWVIARAFCGDGHILFIADEADGLPAIG
jgi:hypothetical protein